MKQETTRGVDVRPAENLASRTAYGWVHLTSRRDAGDHCPQLPLTTSIGSVSCPGAMVLLPYAYGCSQELDSATLRRPPRHKAKTNPRRRPWISRLHRLYTWNEHQPTHITQFHPSRTPLIYFPTARGFGKGNPSIPGLLLALNHHGVLRSPVCMLTFSSSLCPTER